MCLQQKHQLRTRELVSSLSVILWVITSATVKIDALTIDNQLVSGNNGEYINSFLLLHFFISIYINIIYIQPIFACCDIPPINLIQKHVMFIKWTKNQSNDGRKTFHGPEYGQKYDGSKFWLPNSGRHRFSYFVNISMVLQLKSAF